MTIVDGACGHHLERKSRILLLMKRGNHTFMSPSLLLLKNLINPIISDKASSISAADHASTKTLFKPSPLQPLCLLDYPGCSLAAPSNS